MTNVQTKRSFGGRIWWIFRTAFVSLLIVAFLGGLGWAIFYGTTELQRNFNSLGERIDANKQRIELLSDDLSGVKAEDTTGSIAALQATIADLQSQLDTLEETGTAEFTRQSELITGLETGMAAAATSAEAATLGDAVVALQNDINDSNGRLDSLGGENDDVRGEVDDVRAEAEKANAAADAAISDVELAEMRQTVSLFQLWEHIARARLHLAENNVGLATTEVEQTLRLMDLILATAAEEDTAVLELMQTRLSLAFNSLPDDPETAVLDLENAWGQLDAFLTARLYPGVDVEGLLGATAVDEAAASEEAEAVTTPEATSEATATPEATPAPTATPSS
jgi:predicted  nucleic acid-binding Zn-ribbon protein